MCSCSSNIYLPIMRSFAMPPKQGDNKKSADFGTSGPNRSSDGDHCGRSVSSLTTVPVSNVAAVVVTPGSARANRTKKMTDRHRRGGGDPVVPPPPNRTAAENQRLRDSVLRLGELKGQLDGLPGLRELRRQLGEAQGWVQQLLMQQQQLPAGESDSSEQPGDTAHGQNLRGWLQQQSWLASELELVLGVTTLPLLHSVEGWIRRCLEQDASYNQETTPTLTQGEEEERRARKLLQEEQRVLVRELQARVGAIRRGLSQVDLLMQELRRGGNEERTIAEERAGQQELFLRILQALDEILGTAADDDDEGTDAGPIVVVYAGSGSHATMSTVTGQMSEASVIRGGGEEEEDEEGVGEEDEEGVAGGDEKGAAPFVAMDAGSHASMSTVTLTSKGGSPDKREPGSGGS